MDSKNLIEMVTSLFTGLKISFKSAAFGPLQEYWNTSISEKKYFSSFKTFDLETFSIFLKGMKSSFQLISSLFELFN